MTTDATAAETPKPAKPIPTALQTLINEAMADPDRDNTIRAVRAALRHRSGKAWSVVGGTGTAWGWIAIDAPPRRRSSNHDGSGPGEHSTPADRAELGRLLRLDGPVHFQGHNIPASHEYRREYIQRALTGDGNGHEGEPYWD